MTASATPSPLLRVAFQGELGAFSHEAARGAFGADIVMVPRRTFEEMFDAVNLGDADVAVVPIENTLVGSIIKNYDLLVEHQLEIAAELVLRIVHNLIAKPGVQLDEIKHVFSHPVALAQCERFLKANPALQVEQAYDTAGSVKMVMEGTDRSAAGIAGVAAAEVYGAEILVPGIESHSQNFTRFFVLTAPERVQSINLKSAGPGRKTSIVMRIANRPGGLYEALSAFAKEGVDLTKIESRPIEGRPWEYSFYLDLAGAQDAPEVQMALKAVAAGSESVRVLGSYPTLTV
jgi:prephenate dehydratase